jgi:serine/threonine-protein kinase
MSPTVEAGPSPRPATPAGDSRSLGHGRFEPGTRLGPRYRIVAMLGRGGMGEVYRADDLELGQPVALKFLRERMQRDAGWLARFRTEVRLARQVAHPNVARVYDIGEADGHVFLSMEYVDGEDLASVLRRMGRPSRDKALEIARQLCQGLGAAHERGVLHRDLKPANVMIDGRGRVRIMDFGLAAASDRADEARAIVGTPGYMAPEQRASGHVSVQSDLYALGLVLFELFAGRRLDESGGAGRESTGSGSSGSNLPADVDPAVERVIQRCLEEDPGLRPGSAHAVLAALPGGDPLAAALAAGETPSPDLVANAGEAGGLAPAVAGLALLATLALTIFGSWVGAAHYAPMRASSPEALAFEATAAMKALGYDPLPRHTAEGFGYRQPWVDRLEAKRLPAESLAIASPGAVYYWRRYARTRLAPADIHFTLVQLADPPASGAGSAAVLLSPEGRLVGLEAIAHTDSGLAVPRDSLPAVRWNKALELAGIDPGRLVPEARAWGAPVATDTLASWSLADPRALGGRVHVRAGAFRGRITYFAIADSLGAATDAVQPVPASDRWGLPEWFGFVLNYATTLFTFVFAWRNVRLGRVDRRGAFRLAVIVFVATILETVFTWKLSDEGPAGLLDSVVNDRGMGHGLIHAFQIWLDYVALEPYVRRIWPRLLVSWARLTSGRIRDHMVGRDLLAGTLLGVAGYSGGELIQHFIAARRMHTAPDLLEPTALTGIASHGGLAEGITFNVSVAVTQTFAILVLLLVTRLIVRRDRAAMIVAGVLGVLTFAANSAGDIGATVTGVVAVLCVFTAIFRFGLLAAIALLFVVSAVSISPPMFDTSAWWAGRGLLTFGLVAAIATYGAWISLAGRSIFTDPLEAKRG